MSEWEYAIKEFKLRSFDSQGDPEKFTVSGSTSPDEAQLLEESGDEAFITKLSDFGETLQAFLDELGEAGWEVYHIERRDKKKAWLSNIGKEVDYRLFAKRRAEE